MASGFRTGLIYGMQNAEDDQALKDAVSRMDNKVNYGTSAPDGDTPGQIYIKHGSATSDACTLYIKIGSSWYGG